MRNPLLDRPGVPLGTVVRPSPVVGILTHGRGESVDTMFDVMRRIGINMPCIALAAADSTWYPQSFLAPRESNQPHLDWALERIEQEVRGLEAQGWTRARIALIGYSQGACLISEYAFRNPGRWGALIAFTGGLIGPEGTVWEMKGDFHGTPMLLSNGDADPWVPMNRWKKTVEVMRAMNGAVDARLYPGRGHLVCDDEIVAARQILESCLDLA
jgi:predicted esterase